MSVLNLANALISASIATQGAELQSLRLRGEQEVLWQADAAIWPRHAPNLFPIVGRLKGDRLRWQGREYSMPQHGFARDRQFTLLDHGPEHCTLALRDDPSTRDQYPFAFELFITYRLESDGMLVTYEVRNPGAEALPFSIGAHPGFVWPLAAGVDKDAHVIEFEFEEPHPVRRLRDGLMLEEDFPNPICDRRLMLSEDLFAHDAVIFHKLNSHRVTYTAPACPRITLVFDDFPMLGIWSKPGAGFVCIEPWQGHASPVAFDGEFLDKPGVVTIVPGAGRRWTYRIRTD